GEGAGGIVIARAVMGGARWNVGDHRPALGHAFDADVEMSMVVRRDLADVSHGGIRRSGDSHSGSRQARHRLAEDRRKVDDRAGGGAGYRIRLRGRVSLLIDRHGRWCLINGKDLTIETAVTA